MCGNLKFTYEALNQTMSNRTALMCTMQTHTMACAAHSLREVTDFLRYYTVLSGISLLTFWDNLSVPS